MKPWRRALCAALAGSFLLGAGACGGGTFSPYDPELRVDDTRNITPQQYSIYNTVSQNDFGIDKKSKDNLKADRERYVGMFYFLTLGQHLNHYGIYDVSEILKNYGREAFDSNSDISPVGAAHIWGEPIFGYYNSTDEWVIRKQIEMLTFMGIDFLGLDVSNGVFYENVVTVLLKVLCDYRDKGWDIPQLVFYTHDYGKDSERVINEAIKYLKTTFYDREEYAGCWFAPNGKPMMIAVKEAVDVLSWAEPESEYGKLYDYFEFKYWVWPQAEAVNRVVANGMSWMEWTYPQPIHYYKRRGDSDGQISVSVAQHGTVVRFSNTESARGRGWTPETGNDHTRYAQDLNYQLQWDTVREHDDEIKYVFITGWNEWVAEKMVDQFGTYFMVDQYNDEYSRDIEPTRTGALKDNSFLLSTKEVHDYKYTEAKHYKYAELSPDISDPNDPAWEQGATYLDFTGEAIPRSAYRMDGNLLYTDDSNRNDIAAVTVARDAQYLYFRIQTLDDVKPYESGDTRWMNIWLNTQNEGEKNAFGYQYVINRNVSGNKSSVMQSTGDNSYREVGSAEIAVSDKYVCVKIPLKTLGLSRENYDIEFKVSDNIQSQTDFLDFYSTGDCAPCGRLNYKFGY